MDSIRNLSGVLMHKDTPLVKFSIKDYLVTECEILTDIRSCPVEFRWAKTPEQALLLYLEDRLPPETRIGLHKTLVAAGIPYYDPERIIKYSHGYNVSDNEWIQLEGENYSFNDIEQRAAEKSKELAIKMKNMYGNVK